MQSSPPGKPSERPLKLMLIENDPMVRLGLVACFNQHPQLQIVWEAESGPIALRVVHHLETTLHDPDHPTLLPFPDLVVLNLDLEPSQRKGLNLCKALRQQYPQLPVLLIGAESHPEILAVAYDLGAGGFCPRGTECAELVQAINRVASGQPYWQRGWQIITRAVSQPPTLPTRQPQLEQYPGLWGRMGQNLHQSGIDQIDAAIAAINRQLELPSLSGLERLVLRGRRRELHASRWLLNRLYRQPTPPARLPPLAAPASAPVFPPGEAAAIVPLSPSPLLPLAADASRTLQVSLFDAIAQHIHTSTLLNLTETPLEIDILREDKKRELLYTVLRKLEDSLAEVRQSNLLPEQLTEKTPVILQDLWQATTVEFMGKYATVTLSDQTIEVVPVLLQDGNVVQAAILAKIPLVANFLAHLLFQLPLQIDDLSFAPGTVEASHRLQLLLQHLVIQLANAVMQPVLNRFGNATDIKQSLYDRRMLSTREIERFRNNLSWKYRVEQWFREPTAIFESRFNLFILQNNGISPTSIYSPRTAELDQLSGWPLAFTVILETRDAIVPRVQSAISFVGSGVIYILTDVIGRGIGLIGRGIVKGIGNALQDPRSSRNDQRLR
ncbi:MAG: DUF3685 domain-containing protein [Leptolyngbyaceae cyanobacterium]